MNDPLQNLAWDGSGNNLDAFDYSLSGPPPADPDQVDALANRLDFLFNEVQANLATMIVSLDNENFIRNHNIDGSVGIWASAAAVRSPSPPAEVDAVEVWGPIDANHYFYIGDAVLPGPPAPPGTPLRPICGFLDGGELFVWQNGGAVTYLNHGGRIWDTVNPVGNPAAWACSHLPSGYCSATACEPAVGEGRRDLQPFLSRARGAGS